ncbi:hypothetical protein [Salipaludibacillus neizhouensis]|nr:hypothetical protein [Salipaludibacillus neizhouensis]
MNKRLKNQYKVGTNVLYTIYGNKGTVLCFIGTGGIVLFSKTEKTLS